MRIVKLKATPVYVPLKHPLRWSFGVETGMTRVIVEMTTDDGLVGLGESNGGQTWPVQSRKLLSSCLALTR